MATLLPEGKQSFTDGAGLPLVGGKLYTYDAGTNTPRPTYADAAGTTPNTNPVILDARGEATVFWNGAYKVVLKTAADVEVWTVDGVATPEVAGTSAALRTDLANTTDATKGDAMLGWGAITSIVDGILTRHNTLAAAVYALGSNRATIVVRDDVTVSASLTVPVTASLHVQNGAVITVSSGVLTINCKFRCDRATCFAGAGSVSMATAKVANVYAEWFGAAPDDSTESSAPIMRALASAASIPVTLGAGKFRTNAKIVVYGNISAGFQKLYGAGRRTTFIRCAAADAGIQSDQSSVADYIELGNFTVEKVGTTQTQTGLDLGTMRNSKVADITALNFLIGCGLTKNVDALGNYYNQIIRVIAACGSPVTGSIGFKFGNQISGHTNREGNANDLSHCRSYDCESGIWMLGIGNTIKAHKIVSCTNAIMLYETSYDNRIEAYCENATGTMGTAEATCIGNYLDLFNDATSLTAFNDLGWNFITGNTQAGGQGYISPHRISNCGIYDHISATGIVGTSVPIFSVKLPDTNAAARVVVTLSGFTFTVNNWAGIQQWDVYKKAAGTPTVSAPVSSGDNKFTTSAAADGTITWLFSGNASLFSTLQITVSIQGIGSEPGTALGSMLFYKGLA